MFITNVCINNPWFMLMRSIHIDLEISRLLSLTCIMNLNRKKFYTALPHYPTNVAIPSKQQIQKPLEENITSLKIHCKALVTEAYELYSITTSIRTRMLFADPDRIFLHRQEIPRSKKHCNFVIK